jgi:hypothetical protein
VVSLLEPRSGLLRFCKVMEIEIGIASSAASRLPRNDGCRGAASPVKAVFARSVATKQSQTQFQSASTGKTSSMFDNQFYGYYLGIRKGLPWFCKVMEIEIGIASSAASRLPRNDGCRGAASTVKMASQRQT